MAPGWGTGNLVALVSALVTYNQSVSYEIVGYIPTHVTYNEVVLSSTSLVDHTDEVYEAGTIDLSFPTTDNTSYYQLFAFYEKLSHNKNIVFNSSVQNTIFDEGSYIVDHYDAKGAEVVIDFWNDHILSDDIRKQLRHAGNYGKQKWYSQHNAFH